MAKANELIDENVHQYTAHAMHNQVGELVNERVELKARLIVIEGETQPILIYDQNSAEKGG